MTGFGTGRQQSAGSSYAASDAAHARSAAGAAERAAHHSTQRLEKLMLVNMAMWSLIQDKTNLTEDDLLRRVRELDTMDGTRDGKATTTRERCPQCGRTLNPRQDKCLYCGAQKRVSSAFDLV